MDLSDVKKRLQELQGELSDNPTAVFAEFETPHGLLEVIITDRLRRKCRKGRLWKSNAMLTSLKNAAYGLDSNAPRSRGGADGIFRVDPDFRPENSMMKKLFRQVTVHGLRCRRARNELEMPPGLGTRNPVSSGPWKRTGSFKAGRLDSPSSNSSELFWPRIPAGGVHVSLKSCASSGAGAPPVGVRRRWLVGLSCASWTVTD